MAEILEALSHPLRIRILRVLLEDSCCQCNLASRLGEHPVNISRHLAVLTRAGLVISKKQGNKVFPEVLHPEVRVILKEAEGLVRKTAADRVREAKSLKATI